MEAKCAFEMECCSLFVDTPIAARRKVTSFRARRSGKDQKMKKTLALICLCFMLPAAAFAGSTRGDLQARVNAAKEVLDEVMAAQDNSIPMDILEQATCVGVVPGMIKGAFIWGGQYGQGVVTCRTGHGWSAPVFIRMAGGSFGFQIGGQSTDLVLVAVNERGFQDLLKNKFKIGGDASASAGPVGRHTQAATDWKLNAELLTYSRSKGLFAGIDLDGTSVSQNIDDTELYYGQAHDFESVLKGDVAVPTGAVPFVRTVAHYFVTAKNH
jgi:lipid-binding SYLF domain-containing protein